MPIKRQASEENDWTKVLVSGGQERDPRFTIAEPLITSDKNMEAKTRLPHILAMTAMDLYKKWAQGELTSLDELLDYTFPSGGFGDRFRINAPNLDGKAREEYVITSTVGLLSERLEEMLPARLKEGSRSR
jgi:hypothetical protein